MRVVQRSTVLLGLMASDTTGCELEAIVGNDSVNARRYRFESSDFSYITRLWGKKSGEKKTVKNQRGPLLIACEGQIITCGRHQRQSHAGRP
jgi:hypothetical protein